MRKIFILLVSTLLILSSCKENVKAQEDEVNNLNDTELNSAAAYYNRSLAKYESKDYKGAMVDYDKAIKINPNEALVYLNRGACKYILYDDSGACKDARKAQELGYDASELIKMACK